MLAYYNVCFFQRDLLGGGGGGGGCMGGEGGVGWGVPMSHGDYKKQ